jgi:hypothetical protein
MRTGLAGTVRFSQISHVKEFVSRDHEQGNGQKLWMQAKL